MNDRVTWGVSFNRLIPYGEGVRIQERLVQARLKDEIPDVVLFLQHTPVVTMGRRGRDNYLLLSKDLLAQKGIELYRSSRGGDVTFHGPGQWVMYPILKLGTHEADSHGYLTNLEEIAIRTAAEFGIAAFRREGMSGAWTPSGKIAAIGFQLKRWVTLHGMSFNVKGQLEGFNFIVPCGLVGEPIASLEKILGDQGLDMKVVRDHMIKHFETICGRPLTCFDEATCPNSIKELLVDASIPAVEK